MANGGRPKVVSGRPSRRAAQSGILTRIFRGSPDEAERRRPFRLLTLGFAPELEREFRRDYARRSAWHPRGGIALAILLWSVFGLLDRWMIPEVKFLRSCTHGPH